MLELRYVSKRFAGIAAVDDVSFSVRPGEVTGYLGPNGSGKSTTMKMITGLIETSEGEIFFQGKPIQDDLMAYKRRMGYVPEEPYLYNHLSGIEYLTMVAQLRNLPARGHHARKRFLRDVPEGADFCKRKPAGADLLIRHAGQILRPGESPAGEQFFEPPQDRARRGAV